MFSPKSLDGLVPETDRTIAKEALRAWLQEDRDRARAIAARCTTQECQRVFGVVEQGRAHELRDKVRELVGMKGEELADLSPRGRLASVGVPVYLLHGSGDTVIPSTELEWADLELTGRPHSALVSNLITHVEVDKPAGMLDKLALIWFMSHIL